MEVKTIQLQLTAEQWALIKLSVMEFLRAMKAGGMTAEELMPARERWKAIQLAAKERTVRKPKGKDLAGELEGEHLAR